jgi:hypothetical protein
VPSELLYVLGFRCPNAATNACCAAFGVVTTLTFSPFDPNSCREFREVMVAECGDSPLDKTRRRRQLMSSMLALRSMPYSRRKSASTSAQSPIRLK